MRPGRRLSLATATLLLVGGALAGCDAAEKVTGPDPDEAAGALAQALVSGEFGAVAFTEGTPEDVAAEYAKVVEGMGEVAPTVEATGTDESGQDGATATLSWTWSLAGEEWSYTTRAPMTDAGDEWQVTWSRTLIEPSLGPGTVLDVTPIGGGRGPVLGADGVPIVTDRPVVRFGIDRTHVPGARAGGSARRLARLVGVDAAPYVKQVEAAGEKAYVEAIVFRKDDLPVDVAQGYRAIPGALAGPAAIPLAPPPAIATASSSTRSPPTGVNASCSGSTPGRASRCGSPSTSGSRWLPSARSRRSARAVRWSRSGPRPARSSRPRTGPATTATTWRRSASSPPARRSRA